MLLNPHPPLLRILLPIWFILFLYLSISSLTTPPALPKIDRRIYSPPSNTNTHTKTLIPSTIHQLLISMPSHPVSKFTPQTHTLSWLQSGFKIEYWSEDSCYELAQEVDSSGRYAKTFIALPTAVLRSDFCRYLVIFGRGGIYNDLDVHLMHSLPWDVLSSPDEETEAPKFIVGLEGNARTRGLPRSPQFVQWTFAGTAGHGIVKGVLDLIAERTPRFLQNMNSKLQTNPSMNVDDLDVMNWTGPSVWTDAVLAYLKCTKEQVRELKDLKKTKRMGDVVLLPKRGFAVGANEDVGDKEVLVKHFFSGTWKAHSCAKTKSWIGKLLPWGGC